MFRKILIANRGEIACRVIKTARRLGIATVAVYSDADATARHVRMADEAVRIGPPAPRESYLLGDRIIAVAQDYGAEAIHPGYGFLSENAEFAEACEKAGIVFIGPPPAAIRAMGLKGAAKALMEQAKVPIVPGYHDDDQSETILSNAAERIGYPVLIKAVAGGGGKGMRRVDSAADFKSALASAKREAVAAFGNDQVLVEKYLLKPRHIEIQVFADTKGNAVYLFERDCSLQRRHQKVIEEAPAPNMPEKMRQRMGEAAVAAAKAIGYVGAGTVEFIADVAAGLRENAFYFMEMNTRLQVEHPVTEMITGQDLVEWQLRVATGEPLPLGQEQLAIDGHAFEARIYAEDPARNFLPATGRLIHLKAPMEGPHVRVDTGVVEGDEVTPFYDPMIAKLVVWDQTRQAALQRLTQALNHFEVAGLVTNLTFLSAVARHEAFMQGDVDTGFIERYKAALVPVGYKPSHRALAAAVMALLQKRQLEATALVARAQESNNPWAQLDGWRLNDDGHTDFCFIHDGEQIVVTVHFQRQGLLIELADGRKRISAEIDANGRLAIELEGERYHASVVQTADGITILLPGEVARLGLFNPLNVDAGEGDAGDIVLAPMPGKVIQMLVAVGDKVEKGQPLAILEAMKMEHTIAAKRAGEIERIGAATGEQVGEGLSLVVFKAQKES